MPECAPDKVINPATGRCVSRTGKIGMALLQKQCKPDQVVNPATGRCVNKNGKIGREIIDARASNKAGLETFSQMMHAILAAYPYSRQIRITVCPKDKKEQFILNMYLSHDKEGKIQLMEWEHYKPHTERNMEVFYCNEQIVAGKELTIQNAKFKAFWQRMARPSAIVEIYISDIWYVKAGIVPFIHDFRFQTKVVEDIMFGKSIKRQEKEYKQFPFLKNLFKINMKFIIK